MLATAAFALKRPSETLREVVQEVRSKRSIAEGRADSIAKKMEALSQKLTEAEQKCESCFKKNAKLLEENVIGKKSLAEVKAMSKALETERNATKQLRGAIQILKADNKSLYEKLSEAQRLLENEKRVNAESADDRREIERLNALLNVQANDLESERDAVRNLQQSLMELEAESGELRARLEQIELRYQSQLSECEGEKTKLTELAALLDEQQREGARKHQEEIRRLAEKAESLEELYKDRAAKVETEKKRLATQLEENRKLRRDNDELREGVNILDDDMKRKDREIRGLQRQLEQEMRKVVEVSSAEAEELRRTVLEQEKNIYRQKGLISALQHEVEGLRQDYKEVVSKLNEAEDARRNNIGKARDIIQARGLRKPT